MDPLGYPATEPRRRRAERELTRAAAIRAAPPKENGSPKATRTLYAANTSPNSSVSDLTPADAPW